MRSRFDAREKKKVIAHSVTDGHHAALRRPVEGKADEFASPELLDSHERQRRKVRRRATPGEATSVSCHVRNLNILVQLQHALPSLLDELDFSPDEQSAKDLF